MKKIPTLFNRSGKEGGFQVEPTIREGCEWVMDPAIALVTIKVDGFCVKVAKDDKGIPRLYKRLRPAQDETIEAPFVMCNREDPIDKTLYEAYDSEHYLNEGIYEAYGPGIAGNHQNSTRPGMAKIVPVDAVLMLGRGKVALPNVAWGGTSQEFYDTLKAELRESDIEGLVFHWEEPALHPIKFAKIKRKDFGFSWPIPPTH